MISTEVNQNSINQLLVQMGHKTGTGKESAYCQNSDDSISNGTTKNLLKNSPVMLHFALNQGKKSQKRQVSHSSVPSSTKTHSTQCVYI